MHECMKKIRLKECSLPFPSQKSNLIHFERCIKCLLILIVNAIYFWDSVRSDLGPKTFIRPLNHDIRWPSIRKLPITLWEETNFERKVDKSNTRQVKTDWSCQVHWLEPRTRTTQAKAWLHNWWQQYSRQKYKTRNKGYLTVNHSLFSIELC